MLAFPRRVHPTEIPSVRVGRKVEVSQSELLAPLFNDAQHEGVGLHMVGSRELNTAAAAHSDYVEHHEIEMLCKTLHHAIEKRSRARKAVDQDQSGLGLVTYQDRRDIVLPLKHRHLDDFVLMFVKTRVAEQSALCGLEILRSKLLLDLVPHN